MFHFASPYFLILLAPIALTAYLRLRRARQPALASSDAGGVETLARSPWLAVGRHLEALAVLALILMVVALARPQWGTRQMLTDTHGINIILALDLSESMAALDFEHDRKTLNRLEAVKLVVRDFIARRSGDRIGMVVFGSQAYTQLPLTHDYGTIAAILDRLKIGAAGRSTAIGDAIGIALKRLRDIQSRSNIIILLTDGRSNSGLIDPQTAAGLAREKKVRIYTIGVGSRGRAPFRIEDPIFGQRIVYQNVDIDEQTLTAIAQDTGGRYFRATDLEGLRGIYTTIDQLEKTTVKVKTYYNYNDLYLYLLAPALGLLGLWIVLDNTRFLKIP